MRNKKWINHRLIIVSVVLAATLVISINIVVFSSTLLEIKDYYPESRDIDNPSIFATRETHEVYAYVQESYNISHIKIEILALDGIPHRLRLVSNWNVTWYQITTEIDTVGIERPYFYKVLGNKTLTGDITGELVKSLEIIQTW
jgi:hypothetical protein